MRILQKACEFVAKKAFVQLKVNIDIATWTWT